jgi:hypothetical protein
MCSTGKNGYKLRIHADKAKEMSELRYNSLFKVYLCQQCLEYHIAHYVHKSRIERMVSSRYVSPQ